MAAPPINSGGLSYTEQVSQQLPSNGVASCWHVRGNGVSRGALLIE